jgi:hypothetical protein
MQFSFPRYLLSKQSVDDRALNQQVLTELRKHLPEPPLRIIEVGAGIGTMLRRMLRWDVIHRGEYIMVDQMNENIEFAADWLPKWSADMGLSVEREGERQLRLSDELHDVRVRLEQADVFEYIGAQPAPADVLIAHAVLDLLPMPASMPKLLSLTKKLAWFTINFDGLTSLEPLIDAALDEEIERLYHASMDARPTGGDSRSGRHLFGHVRQAGAQTLAAGASDWVVHAVNGKYPQDEADFLRCILHFFEESLTGHAELDAKALRSWLSDRGGQVERGELVYIAHQLDLLVGR